jgi:Fur family peroxide stress response transcriptional regulator
MTAPLRASLAEAFRAAALRPTAQRHAVLEYLSRRPVHATAEEIFRAINRADPRASRATVYNNLRSLARAGLAREVAPAGGASRYEAATRRHHHFRCERCGALEDIAWFDLPPGAGRALLRGRAVRGYEIVFHGACQECAASGRKSGED